MKFVVTKHFGGVVFVSSMIAMQQYYHAFGIVLPYRKTIFTREHLSQFDDMHKFYFKRETSPFGYPDMGAGVYSKKLGYKEWFKFNWAQRVHWNSIEHIVFAIPGLLATGLFYPRIATLLGFGVFIGREWYMNGYLSEGPNSQLRYAGGVTLLASEVLILTMILSIAAWRGYLRTSVLNFRVKKRN